MTKFYDVVAVDRLPPHRVVLMAAWKIETAANGLVALYAERPGAEDKAFLSIPSAIYATGDSYKESLSMSPELSIFTDRPTGMKCGTLHTAERPAEDRLLAMAEEHDLDRLAVVDHSGQPIGKTVERTKLMPRHFV
jgi:hypothetical protein